MCIRDRYSTDTIKSLENDSKEKSKQAQKNHSYASRLEISAIFFGLLSLVLFIFGTFHLLNALPVEEISTAEQKLEQIEIILEK